MAITREQAFGVFEDLLLEGLRPVITGFHTMEANDFWPVGSEGFFVYAHFSSTQRLGVLTSRLAKMDDVARRHGLVAWFSGAEGEYNEFVDDYSRPFRVTFEKDSGALRAASATGDSVASESAVSPHESTVSGAIRDGRAQVGQPATADSRSLIYDEAEVATRGTPFTLASRPPGFEAVADSEVTP